MKEIESKHKVSDTGRIRLYLEKHGAVFLGQGVQNDTFFDRPDRDISRQGCTLRLRIVDQVSAVITWKGPVETNTTVKTRQETEIVTDTPVNARSLLQSIGFEPVYCIEKERTSYTFEDCRVELDRLPLLGTFVEIEGPSQKVVEKVREQLGIESQHIKKSYLAMILEHCKKNGLPLEAASFG